MVKGSCYDNIWDDWYGRLLEVVVLKYWGHKELVCFNCHWFDVENGVKVDKKSGRVTVNVKSKLRLMSGMDEPFILASQATQVYYARSVKTPASPWHAVITTKARGFQGTTPRPDDEPLQVESTSVTPADVTIISESSEEEDDVVAVESEDDVVEEVDIIEEIVEDDEDGDDNDSEDLLLEDDDSDIDGFDDIND